VNPTISVARALVARGHRVAWVAHPQRVAPLLPDGAELLPLGDALPEQDQARIERGKALRGLASIQFLWEDVLVPLGRSMLPGVEDAIARWRPDVLIADQQALAGALAARRLGIAWATTCTTPSWGVVDELTGLPKVREWIDAQVAQLEHEVGLVPIDSPDLSPRLVVIFSTEALVDPARGWPAHYRFVGPSIQDRPDDTPFPWEALAPRPRVFVTLGTVSAEAGGAFYRATVEALRDVDVQVIVAAPPALVPDPPPTFVVRERVPQLALLPHVDAVVCHAGHNTVCEALANGLPLVVAPIRDDQPVVAGQVVRAGAGIRVRYGRVSAAPLREAVSRVLNEPEFRAAAERVRDSFRAAGGAEAAADAIAGLAGETEAPPH
jgi:MGT family glycosyltransferase